MINSQEYITVNKEELKEFRNISMFIYIIWFFVGGALIGSIGFSYQWLNIILYLLSYYIPFLLLERILYRPMFFKRIYSIKWSKDSESHIRGD